MIFAFYVSGLKEGYHMDELYSFGLSNSTQFTFPSANNEWVNSDYFLNYLTVSSGESFDYSSVIHNQINDVHPPVYYVFFHSISSLVPSIFSKWIGISLNIFFYLGTYLLTFKLIEQLIKDRWIGLIGAFFWALSIGAASSIVFIRMYMLLTFFSVALLYVALNIFESKKISLKYLIMISIIVIGGSLTHYYFFIYSFFLVACTCLVLFIRRDWVIAFLFGLCSLAGIIFSYLLFPSMIDHILFGDRGTEAFDSARQAMNIDFTFFHIVNRDLFAGLLGIWIIIGVILYLVFLFLNKNDQLTFTTKKFNGFIDGRKVARTTFVTLIPSICYLFMVQQIAPYESERYIFNIYPALVIAFVVLVYFACSRLWKKNKQIVRIIMSFCFFSINISGFLSQSVNYLYPGFEKISNQLSLYEGTDTFVVSSAFWRTNMNLHIYLELEDIYRMHTPDGSFPTLPNDERLNNDSELLLFLDVNFDNEKRLNEIMENLNFENSDHLFTNDQSVVYYLSN